MSGSWRLRGYVIESLLGVGASGDVWRAQVADTGTLVALKRLPTPTSQDAARAQAEAALLAALDHPNLVRLHAALPVDGATVLVLDLADGGSLAQLLAARGRLTPGETVTAVAPIAAALGYLHDEGVTHGDVSAGNILFTGGGVAMLADVGAARLVGDRHAVDAPPLYVDPAVAAGGLPGPQSDVFMLAAVAVHALTGEPLWRGADAAAAFAAAARADLADVPDRLAAADVPSAMQETLCRALSVEPARRGCAVDLALDLRHSAEALAVELSAGQARVAPRLPVRTGPRHAAAAGRPETRRPPDAADSARPTFERPALLPSGGLAPPTRQVAARPRPLLPRPAQPVLRVPRWLLGALVAAAVATAAVLAWAQRPSAAPQTARPAAVDLPAPRDWGATLRGLDAVRARAFASRDPALLARVYVPGPLLAGDRARLADTVPAGCMLRGARSSYADLRVHPTAGGAVVEAVASLPQTQLACADRPNRFAPAVGPVHLRIVLAATAAGPRISDERAVGGR